MKRTKKNFGFTLIEIVVVVSSVGLVMLVVVGSLLQIIKVQNQSQAVSKLSENGNWILSELRRNMFNSDGTVVCSGNNLSVGITSLTDKLTTVLECDLGSQIASVSGSTTKKLNEDNISVINCTNFASCSVDAGAGLVTAVTFNFRLGTSVSGVGVTRNFSTVVTIRN